VTTTVSTVRTTADTTSTSAIPTTTIDPIEDAATRYALIAEVYNATLPALSDTHVEMDRALDEYFISEDPSRDSVLQGAADALEVQVRAHADASLAFSRALDEAEWPAEVQPEIESLVFHNAQIAALLHAVSPGGYWAEYLDNLDVAYERVDEHRYEAGVAANLVRQRLSLEPTG
jgi:hypothetical protein